MEKQAEESPVHHHHHREMLPVWFFIGVLLLIYGVIILFVGVREYGHPAPVVLSRYHASVWAGVVLTLLGGLYTVKFWPRASRR